MFIWILSQIITDFAGLAEFHRLANTCLIRCFISTCIESNTHFGLAGLWRRVSYAEPSQSQLLVKIIENVSKGLFMQVYLF